MEDRALGQLPSGLVNSSPYKEGDSTTDRAGMQGHAQKKLLLLKLDYGQAEFGYFLEAAWM